MFIIYKTFHIYINIYMYMGDFQFGTIEHRWVIYSYIYIYIETFSQCRHHCQRERVGMFHLPSGVRQA